MYAFFLYEANENVKKLCLGRVIYGFGRLGEGYVGVGGWFGGWGSSYGESIIEDKMRRN